MADTIPDSQKSDTSPAPPRRGDRTVFNLSPLIRVTLLGLYVALLLPIPVLAHVTSAPVSPVLLSVVFVVGGVLLYASLSERVIVDGSGIAVVYPPWVPRLWRSGWSLQWRHIRALKPRSTGQGGIVYYFVSHAGDRAYLLPMRVAGFSRLVDYVQAQTGIDTTDVRPLAQPWMYLILLGFTSVMLLLDSWIIWMALSHQFPVPV